MSLEKLKKMMRKESLLRKKTLVPEFKSHLYQNEKAENMPVLASRLVFNAVDIFKKNLSVIS